MNNNQVKADLELAKESIAEILDNLELKYGLQANVHSWDNNGKRELEINLTTKDK